MLHVFSLWSSASTAGLLDYRWICTAHFLEFSCFFSEPKPMLAAMLLKATKAVKSSGRERAQNRWTTGRHLIHWLPSLHDSTCTDTCWLVFWPKFYSILYTCVLYRNLRYITISVCLYRDQFFKTIGVIAKPQGVLYNLPWHRIIDSASGPMSQSCRIKGIFFSLAVIKNETRWWQNVLFVDAMFVLH